MKNTLVIGASENPARYSYIAAMRLMQYGHQVILFGNRIGLINDVEITSTWNPYWKVDTVTLYVNPRNQVSLYQKIIDLKPRRVIFNPGTENPEFIKLLKKEGIKCEIACTLVLLSLDKY